MLAPPGVEIVVYDRIGDLPHFNPDLDGEGAEPPTAVAELDAKFHLEPEVFRWEISVAPPEPPPRKPRRIPTTGVVEN